MRFAENMVGVCVMSVLLELLLLRVWGRAIPLYRTVLVASIVSGLSWLAIWAWLAHIEWSWKRPDFWTANPAVDFFFLALAGLMWCSVAAVPATITGLIYRRSFLR